MMVIMGFTPLALGNTLPSATYRPSLPQTLPLPSTTPFSGLVAILHVPIWCADDHTPTGGLLPTLRTLLSHLANSLSLNSGSSPSATDVGRPSAGATHGSRPGK